MVTQPKNKDFEPSFFMFFWLHRRWLAMIEEEILKQSSNLVRICISLLYGANTYKDYEIAHLQQKVLKMPSSSSKGSKSLFFGRVIILIKTLPHFLVFFIKGKVWLCLDLFCDTSVTKNVAHLLIISFMGLQKGLLLKEKGHNIKNVAFCFVK